MTLKAFLKRNLPEHHKFKDHEHLRYFGELLHDPNIWHLTRRSAAGGVAVGLFCAFIPVPIQTIIAGAAAIFFRVNLPLSIVFVWISNPITIAPMFIFAYKLGAWIIDVQPMHLNFQLSIHWLSEIYIHIWKPLLLGCFILGTFSAIIGYVSIKIIWRMALIKKWELRKEKRTFQKD